MTAPMVLSFGRGVAVLGVLLVVALLGCDAEPLAPALDEAKQAGREASSFPQADEDWFHDMDSGVELTSDEVRGRNSWLVWTGGNQAMWDYLATTASAPSTC